MDSEKTLREELSRLKSENQELFSRLQSAEEGTKELDRKSYNLFILYHASRSLGSILDVEELLQLTIDMTTEVMGVDWGLLYLVDEEHERLALRKTKSIEQNPFPEVLSIGEGMVEWSLGKAEMILFDKLSAVSPFLNAFPEIRQFEKFNPSIIVPLFHKVRFVGLLVLGARLDGLTYSENDLELLNTIASLSATAFMNAHLYEMAIRDGTTKLFVPRYFRQRLQEEVKRAKRYFKPLSLIMLDIDDFKGINDTYGHPHGDQVLAQISAVIRKCCREDVDIPCRYGGEEFAIVLPETDSDGAFTVADRIRATIDASSFLKEELHITVSAGVAAYPVHASTMEEIVERADLALYESKRAGKNKVTIHNASLLKGTVK